MQSVFHASLLEFSEQKRQNHKPGLAANRPLGHGLHSVAAGLLLYVPGEHGLHVVDDCSFVYVPRRQG